MRIENIALPLSLRTDGELRIVFIGTGTAFTTSLFQTNLLIIKGNDHLLVDLGSTGPEALRAVAGLRTTDVHFVLPTHSHADHIGGLEHMLLAHRYFIGSRPKMVITPQYAEVLWQTSLRGGLEWNEIDANGSPLTLADYTELLHPQTVEPLPNGRQRWEYQLGSIHLELFRTVHIPSDAKSVYDAFPSYGLYIDRRVFFSGDTQYDPELLEYYAPLSEAIFHDASLRPNPVHACIDDLVKAQENTRKKMWLMHYQDNAPAAADISPFAGWAIQGMAYIFD